MRSRLLSCARRPPQEGGQVLCATRRPWFLRARYNKVPKRACCFVAQAARNDDETAQPGLRKTRALPMSCTLIQEDDSSLILDWSALSVARQTFSIILPDGSSEWEIQRHGQELGIIILVKACAAMLNDFIGLLCLVRTPRTATLIEHAIPPFLWKIDKVSLPSYSFILFSRNGFTDFSRDWFRIIAEFTHGYAR